ncbi:MAG: hypothetical protein KatS3mg003_1238 [Candidatus Nitrosocaldaceae archaeon]|nr:MAG: hypothetical protein KatS3mg003_1238 [Candidatus Nitrosocaldaceae archaeon]
MSQYLIRINLYSNIGEDLMDKKRRNKEEILADILHASINGATKSRIMYNSFLNYSQLEKYLNYALDLGLLEHNNSIYKITDKGREYLNLFDRLKEAEDDINSAYTLLAKFLR